MNTKNEVLFFRVYSFYSLFILEFLEFIHSMTILCFSTFIYLVFTFSSLKYTGMGITAPNKPNHHSPSPFLTASYLHFRRVVFPILSRVICSRVLKMTNGSLVCSCFMLLELSA